MADNRKPGKPNKRKQESEQGKVARVDRAASHAAAHPSLFDELLSCPVCELVGGPLDGQTFRLPSDKMELNLTDSRHGAVDHYARDGESAKFRYRGRTLR